MFFEIIQSHPKGCRRTRKDTQKSDKVTGMEVFQYFYIKPSLEKRPQKDMGYSPIKSCLKKKNQTKHLMGNLFFSLQDLGNTEQYAQVIGLNKRNHAF